MLLFIQRCNLWSRAEWLSTATSESHARCANACATNARRGVFRISRAHSRRALTRVLPPASKTTTKWAMRVLRQPPRASLPAAGATRRSNGEKMTRRRWVYRQVTDRWRTAADGRSYRGEALWWWEGAHRRLTNERAAWSRTGRSPRSTRAPLRMRRDLHISHFISAAGTSAATLCSSSRLWWQPGALLGTAASWDAARPPLPPTPRALPARTPAPTQWSACFTKRTSPTSATSGAPIGKFTAPAN